MSAFPAWDERPAVTTPMTATVTNNGKGTSRSDSKRAKRIFHNWMTNSTRRTSRYSDEQRFCQMTITVLRFHQSDDEPGMMQ